jgi:hypothetical protein
MHIFPDAGKLVVINGNGNPEITELKDTNGKVYNVSLDPFGFKTIDL